MRCPWKPILSLLGSPHASAGGHVRYVAFLRGVNVGGRTIPMADVRECLTALGFGDVSTVLQSGNVLFERDATTAAAARTTIEHGLSERFGYDAKALVYRFDQLAGILGANPFDTRDGSCHTYVLFLDRGLERQLADEAGELDDAVEAVQAGDGVVYWRVVKGETLKSPFAKLLTKARYRDANTNRNANTLEKVLAR
jgi:uncharacterized protein (DUF1697 family)